METFGHRWQPLETHGKLLENRCHHHGKLLENLRNPLESFWKTGGKLMENFQKTLGKLNLRETSGKPQENLRKV